MGEEFTVTEAHLRLLERFNIGWCGDEYGAPCMDPKRPYGNSDVEGDVCEILGLEPTDEHKEYAATIHKDMQTVLQLACVFASCGGLCVGVYQNRSQYKKAWVFIG